MCVNLVYVFLRAIFGALNIFFVIGVLAFHPWIEAFIFFTELWHMHNDNLLSSTPVFRADSNAGGCISRNILRNYIFKILFRFGGFVILFKTPRRSGAMGR